MKQITNKPEGCITYYITDSMPVPEGFHIVADTAVKAKQDVKKEAKSEKGK